ncbi:F0F1 ATP synthase subunit delta [Janibacter alkaliphilus]|uniref:ATP synthase subunit delta n=1 Tax=Janibacter alkaliphilus TaxID=1069963 RepID=A0A852X3H8_9MICO|nr:F0F1 ATP synthase subunit delta [Janibacter alkaliphilus]NYG37429.1 F-type H+-transporting ATPase subunit delta [Janibacter alkaliphilus]
MRGASRFAVAESRPALEQALAGQAQQTGEELFGVTALLDDNATLRRAVVDPSREGSDRSDLVRRLLGGKVSEPTVEVVATLAAQRWSRERDLTDTLERFAVEGVLKGAEDALRIDAVEDELFRFERIVAGTPELRDALANRQAEAGPKAELVSRLLEGKAAAETVRLARQAVLAPRGRRIDRSLETYLAVAAERREQVTAEVTTAGELSEEQRTRLSAALQRLYGKPVLVQQIIDPDVIGGIRVQVGDEVVDGTVLRRLEQAKRHLAG